MAKCSDKVIGVGESSDPFLLEGYCDIVVQGLTAGAVKLEYLLPPTANLPAPVWTNFPNALWSEDTYETLFISEHGVMFRLTGVGNNEDIYVRMSRYLNS